MYDFSDITSKDGIRSLSPFSAQRFILPFADVYARLLVFISSVQNSGVIGFRNRLTDRRSFGHNCGQCPIIHSLFEIDTLEDQIAFEHNERYVVASYGAVPAAEFLAEAQGIVEYVQKPIPHISNLIDFMSTRHPNLDDPHFNAEFALEAIKDLALHLMEGNAVLALDRHTGRTAIGVYCDDCKKTHPLFLLGIPSQNDMRKAHNVVRMEDPWDGQMYNFTRWLEFAKLETQATVH